MQEARIFYWGPLSIIKGIQSTPPYLWFDLIKEQFHKECGDGATDIVCKVRFKSKEGPTLGERPILYFLKTNNDMVWEIDLENHLIGLHEKNCANPDAEVVIFYGFINDTNKPLAEEGAPIVEIGGEQVSVTVALRGSN